MELRLNHKKVARIMSKYGLKAIVRTVNRSRVALQKNKKNIAVKNVLNRQFKQKIPYKFASTDITYLRHQNRFSFLSVIKDLASGEIIAYHLSKKMNLSLVMKTMDNLEEYFKRNDLKIENLLLHSDHGFQYTNVEYHDKLKSLNITQSMSRRGNSVDNAPIESFFGHLKDEVDSKDLNFSHLRNSIDRYIIYYNTIRQQWSRKKMSPIDYRNYILERVRSS